MARRGLLKTVQFTDDLSNRFQGHVKDALETLAADHDLVTAPVLSMQVSGPIATGTTFVAFLGPAGQTLTLPPASAAGTSQGVVLWLQNTSLSPVTVAAPAASTIDGGRTVVVPAGSFAAFIGDGVNKWLSGGITMIGNKTNNAAAAAADNIGALVAQANAAAQAWTEGRLVLLSSDLVGNLRVREPESALMVTATAAVNTGFTLTLPAAGAGLFHYITSIDTVRATNATATAAAAALTITTTNLPGSPVWTFGNASVAGGTTVLVRSEPTRPLKSAAANTATTIVVPAAGAGEIIRANVQYYTGP